MSQSLLKSQQIANNKKSSLKDYKLETVWHMQIATNEF